MSDHPVIVNLPDELFNPIQQIAQATARPIEQVVVEQLQTVVGISLPALPSDEEAELAAFKFLSDDTLRGIAREQMPRLIQDRMQVLMDRNNFGTITQEEYKELSEFVERAERLTLRKAWAAGILMERGHKITAQDMSAEDA